jgi:TfoX/Sxy family transcriptional regulator of competence genes
MKMPRPSEESKAALARVMPDGPGITVKPMFGQMSGFVNGNMFIGIFGDELILRLPEEEIARVKTSGGRDFEPVAGHKMGGYVVFGGAWKSKPPRELIDRALDHARNLPAKKPTKKPKKK